MHYTAHGLEVLSLSDQDAKGLFASRPFAKGELLVVWGSRIITGAELAALAPEKRHWMIQIDEDLFQLTEPDNIGGADYVNHSCDPNAGILGHIALVALRPIATGEEICFDYGTTDSTRYCEFQCWCGSPNCRGWVKSDDWRRSDLRARYGRHFSPYLLRRMDAEAEIAAIAVPMPRRRRPRLRVVAGAPPPPAE
jgi:hypothetical protein